MPARRSAQAATGGATVALNIAGFQRKGPQISNPTNDHACQPNGAGNAGTFSPRRWLVAASVALPMALAPLAGLCAAAETPATAPLDARGDKIEIQISPYTHHFSESSEHTNVLALALSSVHSSGWLWGGAYFRNSFGQPCVYVFGGRKYEEPFGLSRTYWNWTAGILYGYKPPYENKVPYNHNGFSPGIVPTIGYRVAPGVGVQASLLGSAAVMFSLVLELDRGRGDTGSSQALLAR